MYGMQKRVVVVQCHRCSMDTAPSVTVSIMLRKALTRAVALSECWVAAPWKVSTTSCASAGKLHDACATLSANHLMSGAAPSLWAAEIIVSEI